MTTIQVVRPGIVQFYEDFLVIDKKKEPYHSQLIGFKV